MPITSVTAFMELLADSRLLSPAQQEELTHDLAARFPEPRALARHLLEQGWLTPYQVNQVFQGRGRQLVLGHYVLLERLGEGGMGQVFKGRHQLMSRVVALKIIKKEFLSNPDAVRRFQREIVAAAQLSHPNCVHAYEIVESGDTTCFVMEYVEGTDLARLVQQRGPLPVAEACDYVAQAARGLQHAHERGLVHRDIKPGNLLLTKTGNLIKVLDMGLARLQPSAETALPAASLTVEGSVMGTPDYIAPEQAQESHTVDIRADIYSLGCTLYFLLTGQPPFPGGTLMQKLMKHQQLDPVPVELLRKDVPAALSAVLRRMIAKRPEERYQTPQQVADALEPFLESDAPPLAIPIQLGAVVDGQAATVPAGTPQASTKPDSTIVPGQAPRGLPARLLAAGRRRPVLAAAALMVPVLAVLLAYFWPGRSKPAPQPPPEEKPVVERIAVLGDESGRHWGTIRCVAVDPSSKVVASAGDDRVIRLWEAGTLRERGVLIGHAAPVWALVFTPDGKQLVSGGDDQTVRLWDVEGCTEVRRFGPQTNPVRALALSADGGLLATAGSGQHIGLFDVQGGALRLTMPGSQNTYGMTFLPDGRHLLTAGNDGQLHVRALADGKDVRQLKGDAGPINRLAVSADGNLAATSGDDGVIRLWDLGAGTV